ncbi:MAG: AAA family ATPase, partial [Gammaproteobacteria bacterium]|nr:AAA family ATPase [Gammaproteobacteria bacterium]
MSVIATVDKPQPLISALQQAEAYSHTVEAITLFETHISWVLLTGEYVYKIKKPVNFGFLDFSTLEKRRFYCEEELRVNRRLAPQLYLSVVPICGTPDTPQMNGTGTVFEYAVKMRQFDPQKTFDELLTHNALTLSIIDETAAVLAGFHQQITVAGPDTHFGTPAAIEQPVQENFAQLKQALADTQNVDNIHKTCTALKQWSQKHDEELLVTFQHRKQAGFIRECHGDLHLRNIVLWNHQVVPFDGIEFNANLRWIDVMSELAFLLMDLDDHQQKKLSRQLLNRYLSLTGDYDGLVTLRFYQVYRAMVRAKVASLRLAQISKKSETKNCLEEIHNYTQLAENYTQPSSVNLVITRGLSGSGKSYLAQQLALNADLIHLRSDVERKRLFGLGETDRSDSQINTGIYQKEATHATYDRLYTLAETCITSGFSVIVDATFLQHSQRNLFRSLAQQVKCHFRILDCQTTPEIMRQRIQQREQQGTDASEANLQVLE